MFHLFWTPNFCCAPWQHESFDSQDALDKRHRELCEQEEQGEIEDLAAHYYLFHGVGNEGVCVAGVLHYLTHYSDTHMALPYSMERQDDGILLERRYAQLRGRDAVMLRYQGKRYWLPDALNDDLAGLLRDLVKETPQRAEPVEKQDAVRISLFTGFRNHTFTLSETELRTRRRSWHAELQPLVMGWIRSGAATTDDPQWENRLPMGELKDE